MVNIPCMFEVLLHNLSFWIPVDVSRCWGGRNLSCLPSHHQVFGLVINDTAWTWEYVKSIFWGLLWPLIWIGLAVCVGGGGGRGGDQAAKGRGLALNLGHCEWGVASLGRELYQVSYTPFPPLCLFKLNAVPFQNIGQDGDYPFYVLLH